MKGLSTSRMIKSYPVNGIDGIVKGDEFQLKRITGLGKLILAEQFDLLKSGKFILESKNCRSCQIRLCDYNKAYICCHFMYEKVNPCHHHQFRINGPFIDFNELPSVMIIGETKSVVTEPIFQTITVEKGYQERNGVCVIPLKQSPARRQRTCVDRRMRNRKKEMSKLNEKSESPYVSRPNSPSIDLNRD